MMNTKLSDHNTLIISLSYGMAETEDKRINQAVTDIPEYDLKNGDDEDWLRVNMLLQNINWEDKFEDKNVDEMTDIFLEICENNVKKDIQEKGRERRMPRTVLRSFVFGCLVL